MTLFLLGCLVALLSGRLRSTKLLLLAWVLVFLSGCAGRTHATVEARAEAERPAWVAARVDYEFTK